MQRLVGREAVKEVIFNETELCIFKYGFEKRCCQFGESYFIYYTWEAVLVMKKTFSLFYCGQL